MTIGRGVRRRRRKKGLTKRSRLEMTTGPSYLYKVEYDLKVGDIFRFRHRHKVIDCSKVIGPRGKRHARHYQEKWIDFPKGSLIVWAGSYFVTEFGNFVPRKYWWESFPALVDPLSSDVQKRVRLRMWKPTPKPNVIKMDITIGSTKFEKKPLTESFLEWVRKTFLNASDVR